VALEATTGKLCWYFQFTPGDTHDWDAVQIPVLVDATLGLSPRKLLAWANRNGFFYLLDRVTGKFLLGTPFARQTWADGLDASGRPRMRPESRPSREGSEVYPNQIGATNWWSPSYDPAFQLLYVPVIDRGAIFLESAEVVRMAPDEETMIAVKALDVTTGRVRWQYKRSPRPTLDEMGGLLSTTGGIVFGGDHEVFFALDAETGAELWRFNTGGLISAAPVTYKVDGQQYVAIAAGRSILAFGLPR
jgi:alcohol dehydrogenase (cytochrome c)